MTSNIGASSLLEGINECGEIEQTAQEQVMSQLRMHFRPEFLNRLDEIILFKPLTKENTFDIIKLILTDLNDRLLDRNISVSLTKEAMEYVVDHAYDPIYGARPLKRFVQTHVETMVARMLLADQVKEGDCITISVEGDGLTCKV